jgi:hypothetical protein
MAFAPPARAGGAKSHLVRAEVDGAFHLAFVGLWGASNEKEAVTLRFMSLASVRRHRRAQRGSPMRRSIRPKRARRPSDASVDPTQG